MAGDNAWTRMIVVTSIGLILGGIIWMLVEHFGGKEEEEKGMTREEAESEIEIDIAEIRELCRIFNIDSREYLRDG